MEIKHGGCWYCGSKSQSILKAIQKPIIDQDGNREVYAVALCDTCITAQVLDQRVPKQQRRG